MPGDRLDRKKWSRQFFLIAKTKRIEYLIIYKRFTIHRYICTIQIYIYICVKNIEYVLIISLRKIVSRNVRCISRGHTRSVALSTCWALSLDIFPQSTNPNTSRTRRARTHTRARVSVCAVEHTLSKGGRCALGHGRNKIKRKITGQRAPPGRAARL